MTFDREPDLDNANVGKPVLYCMEATQIRVASILFFKKRV